MFLFFWSSFKYNFQSFKGQPIVEDTKCDGLLGADSSSELPPQQVSKPSVPHINKERELETT